MNKKIHMKQTQQGPYQDAHMILMQNELGDKSLVKNKTERGFDASKTSFSTKEDPGFLPNMKTKEAFNLKRTGQSQGRVGKQYMSMNKFDGMKSASNMGQTQS